VGLGPNAETPSGWVAGGGLVPASLALARSTPSGHGLIQPRPFGRAGECGEGKQAGHRDDSLVSAGASPPNVLNPRDRVRECQPPKSGGRWFRHDYGASLTF